MEAVSTDRPVGEMHFADGLVSFQCCQSRGKVWLHQGLKDTHDLRDKLFAGCNKVIDLGDKLEEDYGPT